MRNQEMPIDKSETSLGKTIRVKKQRTKPGMDRSRLLIGMGLFAICFSVIIVRLVSIVMTPLDEVRVTASAEDSLATARPDIFDRNGEILATDIKTPSLYADPRKVLDIDETIEGLTQVLPDLDQESLRRNLNSGKAFTFIKREVTPRQQAAIHELGLPGIGFVEENRRIYPAGNTTSYILGHVDIDNVGIAGIEKYVDRQGLGDLHAAGFAHTSNQKAINVSVDLRVQHSLRDELSHAMQKYHAKAAFGVITDVHTGEVVAMSSLPDYNPDEPKEALEDDKLNRVVAGVYEMGSVFKVFTVAMVLDAGIAALDTVYDATNPIKIASFSISDFHGAKRPLTVSEAFTKSSNIATAKMALDVGVEGHKQFLRRLGFFSALRTELPETAKPLIPSPWRKISSMTIAFGHGLSVTPLQVAAAGAAMINGGYYITPTFLTRSVEQANKIKQRVIDAKTSEKMRYLMRKNATHGTARRADENAQGFMVGGKTGTADKLINGSYKNDKRMTSFLGAFPMNEPRYMVFITLDEPEGIPETNNRATSSVNAVPTAGRLITRVAPMLGVAPKFDRIDGEQRSIEVSY